MSMEWKDYGKEIRELLGLKGNPIAIMTCSRSCAESLREDLLKEKDIIEKVSMN